MATTHKPSDAISDPPRSPITSFHLPTHSRNNSGKSDPGSRSTDDSAPTTPRSTNENPFSPPGSSTSVNAPEQHPPSSFHPMQRSHIANDSILSVPRSVTHSVSTSVADLSRGPYSLYGNAPVTVDFSSSRPSTGRMSNVDFFSSRPSTGRLSNADFSSSRPSTGRVRESFASPKSRPLTMYSTPPLASTRVEKDRPKSTMLSAQGPIEKPWVSTRDPYARISYFLTYFVMLLGAAAGAARCFISWRDTSVIPGQLCLVMDENFDSADGVFGENGKFFREVDTSGFGNGQFEMTTDSDNNSYVHNGRLYITPTFTSDVIGMDALLDGHIFNITDCSFNITQGLGYTSTAPQIVGNSTIGQDQAFDAEEYYKACSAVSNATSGQIINPIQSARISTRKTANIKYGRVEVRAKIPRGDWLWPAIWMLPLDNEYGTWPLSGEIDIMESRGNDIRYPMQGSNYVRGSLNWGPAASLNRVWKTYGWWTQRRKSYADDFHTYALEWTEDFIRIYVDTRLHHMLDLRIKESFWDRGDFPKVTHNGSEAVILENPWNATSKAAPFDQPFYLILNVAVGGTNGWFPDGNGGKPWLDGSTTAKRDFWGARDQWQPTWSSDPEQRSLVVDSVKMWQMC